MIEIDGSMGEGGGQVLRSALALAILTGQAVQIDRIRARRAKPGLMRQHLTGVLAAAKICGGRLDGATLRSRSVRFEPGAVRPGRYHFDVGTAGSACLVLQTVLPPLLQADGESEVVVEGGTHNTKAPPYDFLARTFGGALLAMGAELELRIERYGFYPAGGGRIVARIGRGPREPVALTEPGPPPELHARVLLSRLPEGIGRRELRTLAGSVALATTEIVTVDSPGPGNVVMVEARRGPVDTVLTGFGERGVPAERVAVGLANEVERFLLAGVPVDEHLADQLLLPGVLAGGITYLTTRPSLHTRTNAAVIERFTGARITFEEEPDADRCVVRLATSCRDS